MIMVTFTKLFDINIVASSLSEWSNRYLIFLSATLFSSSILFKSFGEREKKAISEADMKPDAYNNAPANIIDTIAPKDGAVIVTSLIKSDNPDKNESESKEYCFS